MEGLVSIPEFINYMKANDLVLVKKSELQNHVVVDLAVRQANALSKKALTISEIVSAELLPIKSRQGVHKWIQEGKIHAGEVVRTKEGKIKVLTMGIKRIRKEV